jgi:hypothetical protein
MTDLKTNICMVLDRSGSMDTCKAATIDAVNKYLLEVRQDSNLKDAGFTLLSFDTEAIDTMRDGTPATVSDISADDYIPRGGTPLYDAIGRGIDGLDAKEGKAILVIVTDGQENASRKYNHEAISGLIKTRQDKGWLVVFLGAGLSSAQQGLAMGINAGYVANIGLDPVHLHATMDAMVVRSSGYSRTRSMAEAASWAGDASNNFNALDRRAMGDATGGDSLLKKTEAKKAKVAHIVGAPIPVKDDSWNKPRGDAWAK